MTGDGLRDGSLLAAARLRAPPGTVFQSDAAIQADLDAALATHAPWADVWLFGYGSPMWNPALEYAECRPAGIKKPVRLAPNRVSTIARILFRGGVGIN